MDAGRLAATGVDPGQALAAALEGLGTHLALGVVEDGGTWVLASEGLRRMLGRDPVAHPERGSHREPDLDGRAAVVLATGVPVGDVDLVGVDGSRWRTSFRPTDVGGRSAVAVAATDVTTLVDEVTELRHDVAHDPLTGLLNRRELVERLTAALARARRSSGVVVGVVFADIDGFKQVNDRFGHRVGDAVLVAVARRLQAAVRRGDTLGRLGGDEFVLVREEASGDADLAGLLDRVASALALPVVVDGHRIPVTLTLGLATASDGQDAQRAIEVADLAMYERRHRPVAPLAVVRSGSAPPSSWRAGTSRP